MKIKRAFIKGTNWALAGLIGLLGFTNCEEDMRTEYGTPNADYTVKGTVVDKATGKPIKGIRVGYDSQYRFGTMYGVFPTPYQPKASVTTDAKGEYKLTELFYISDFPMDDNSKPTFARPVYIEDIDREINGLYSDTIINVDFKNAVQTGKPGHWYNGEFTVTKDIQLTEQKSNE